MRKRLESKKALPAVSADSSRRSFFWKLGAGVSTALATTAGLAGAETSGTENLALKVALLEDEKAIRDLHRAFELAMDQGRYDEVVGMFSDDAEVVFNGGVFRNRSHGVSRLYRERFASGQSGRRMEQAPGFALGAGQLQDSVNVAPDRKSAEAVFPYSIQIGVPIESETSLASMARLQGEGVRTWWEGGTYHATYEKDVAENRWKIGRLEYATRTRADYRPGRSYAGKISVPALSERYPQDRYGPDALI